MKTVRYAIVGFGGIAENRIAKEGFALDRRRFAPLRGVELAGVTDVSTARRKAARALGLRWFASVDEVLDAPDIQAVFIATNNGSHYPLARRALRAGKHVLLEKPMATTVADAARLVNAAVARGLSLAVDHMMVHNALNRKVRGLVARGGLGEVNDIELHMEFLYGTTPAEARTWRCARTGELGGPIGDVGSHCLYMAEFLLGEPIVEIRAVYEPKTLAIAVEDGAVIRFRTVSGRGGTARVSFARPRGSLAGTLLNLGYEIYGSAATARTSGTLFQLSGHADEPVRIRADIEAGSADPRPIRAGRVRNIYQEVILRHAASIRAGRPMTGEDGLHNLRLVAAAHKSATADGRPIPIS
jgi:1,5-anhydro-D-fructose reductase (1,5-anhydro-D-mannitol-forming)